MIYNFAQLLRTQFPTEVVYVDGRVKLTGQQTIPSRCLLVVDTGGVERPWILRQTATVQITARDVDAPRARKLAHDVFNFITSRFGLILPQITVGGVSYPQVQTAQISATQLPYDLGPDEDGRFEYVVNFEIIRER